jgi:hypothetical protein
MEYHLTLFADYFQFYLQDEYATDDVSRNIWAGDAVNNLLALTAEVVHVGTVRNMTVPVTIIVTDSPPTDDDFGSWDHINECSLNIPSGRLLVAGCTDYFPDAPRFDVAPGCYRLRLYYGGLRTLSPDGLEGDDHYQIILWLAPPDEAKILRRTADSYC